MNPWLRNGLLAGGVLLAGAGLASRLLPPPGGATYADGSACASVQRLTPIDQVPYRCGLAWKAYDVHEVPGQDLMKNVPAMPPVSRGAGVDATQAQRLATAFWRMQAFKTFALQSRQVAIVDGLGVHYFYRRVSPEVGALLRGGAVPTPVCHEFPSALRVVALAPDFAAFTKRGAGSLGLKATYPAPCSATAVFSDGKKVQLYDTQSPQEVVFVGDTGSGDPLGAVLVLAGLGDCRETVVMATCRE